MKTKDTKTKTEVEKKYFFEKKNVKNHSIKIIEVGGPKGKEPTRYGDWEKNGRCSDF